MPFRGQSTITVVLPAGQDNTQQAVTFANASTTPVQLLQGGDITIGTLTGNLTLADPIGMVAGDNLTLHFTQDATGGRTVTLPASFKGPVINAGIANLKRVLEYKYDGTNWMPISDSGWDGVGTSGASSQSQNVTFAAAGSAINIALGNVVNIAPLTGNLIMSTPVGMTANQFITFKFEQDSVGSRVVTTFDGENLEVWPANTTKTIQYYYDGAKFARSYAKAPGTGSGSGTSVVRQDIVYSATPPAVNLALGNDIFFGQLTGNITLVAAINGVSGTTYTYHFQQDSTGGRSVTFPDGLAFAGGTSLQKMVLSFIFDGVDFILVDNSQVVMEVNALNTTKQVTYAQASSPIDLTNATRVSIAALTGPLDIPTPINAVEGNIYEFDIVQGGAGNYLVRFASGVGTWTSFGYAPVGARKFLFFKYTGGNFYQIWGA